MINPNAVVSKLDISIGEGTVQVGKDIWSGSGAMEENDISACCECMISEGR